MVQLVTWVGHVDTIDDLAEVGLFRVGADHGDEVGVGLALGDGADVEESLLLILSVRSCGRGCDEGHRRQQRRPPAPAES